jgi:NADP-dependent 3-hydroxy acid dehydrogenase YdfG
MTPRFPANPARRVGVVTGASSGIGAATAVALAQAGHPVVLGARRVGRLEELADQIRAAGGEAAAISLDLADTESIDSFAAAAPQAFGPVEIIVSNAGEVLPRAALAVDPDEFAKQVQVNVLGAHRLVRALGPGMVERQRGDIVFVTSNVVRLPRPFMSAYVTSKHALEGLARAMQMELEGTGVRVGMVRPGPVLTEQGSGWDAETLTEVLGQWERWGLLRHDSYLGPEHIAAAVMAMVTTPRGAHLTLIEVEPEGPVATEEGAP